MPASVQGKANNVQSTLLRCRGNDFKVGFNLHCLWSFEHIWH